jgi:hypothetical protein
MQASDRRSAFASRFIRFGALSQLLWVLFLLASSVIQPIGGGITKAFDSLRLPVQETIVYGMLGLMVVMPIIGAALYPALPLDRKAGTEGLILLLWWIALLALFLFAYGLGGGF